MRANGAAGLPALEASLNTMPISPSNPLRKASPRPPAAAADGAAAPCPAPAPAGDSFLPHPPSETTNATMTHARVNEGLIDNLYPIYYRLCTAAAASRLALSPRV